MMRREVIVAGVVLASALLGQGCSILADPIRGHHYLSATRLAGPDDPAASMLVMQCGADPIEVEVLTYEPDPDADDRRATEHFRATSRTARAGVLELGLTGESADFVYDGEPFDEVPDDFFITVAESLFESGWWSEEVDARAVANDRGDFIRALDGEPVSVAEFEARAEDGCRRMS